MITPKTAVLFADRKGAELAPLNEHFAPANLPIGGKCALEFWFEYLCEQKFNRVYLFVGSHSSEIKSQFPSGDHWGFELHYLPSRGEEVPTDLVARYPDQLPKQFCALRADIVPQPRTTGSIVHLAEIDLGFEKSREKLDQLSWKSVQSSAQTPHLLASLQEYAEITERILHSKLWCCTPRGLMLDDHKWTATPEFSNDRVDAIDGSLYVGRDTVVDRSVSMEANVSVESGSFVDRGATLKNAIVLPGTYVGQNVSLENCLAYGSLMIDLKHGIAQQIDDPALLSPITSNARVTRTTNSERFVAAFLMLVSAWAVLPIALLFKRRGATLTAKTTSRSNRGSRKYPIGFESLSFNTGWNSMNNWPKLIHVIDGDLKLFGTELEELEYEPVLADLPISQGVFTPKNLHPNHLFDEVEEQLWGLELANARNGFFKLLGKSIKAISNTLFRRSAAAA